jgi:hypothetical protein
VDRADIDSLCTSGDLELDIPVKIYDLEFCATQHHHGLPNLSVPYVPDAWGQQSVKEVFRKGIKGFVRYVERAG